MTRRDFLKKGLIALPVFVYGMHRATGATVKQPLPTVDLDFISSKIELLRRSEWTDTVPRTWRLREMGNYDRITVHHAGDATNYHTDKNAVLHDIEGIHTGHVDRNYGDIGYHFILDYAGRVWEGRSLAYEGAHVAGQNERNIGVVCLGNFEEQDPSKEQVASMNLLAKILKEHFGIKGHRVYGHRDLGQSACPGRTLYPYVSKLKLKA